MSEKPRPRRVHPPTEEQVNLIADAAGTIVPQMRVVLLVMAWSGLRPFEAAKLEYGQIREQEDGFAFIDVIRGKGREGGKDRAAILLPEGLTAIKTLPGADLRGPQTPLFVRPMRAPGDKSRWMQGAKFERRTIGHGFEKARAMVGLDQFIPYDLRKFYASYLLNIGVSEMDVAIALGHTDKYGRPNVELVQKTYGFVNIDKALFRAAGVAINERVRAAKAEATPKPGAADGGAGARERVAVLPQGGEGVAGVGRDDVGGGVVLPGAAARDDEGPGGAAGVEGDRPDQGRQVPADDFAAAIDKARRSVRRAPHGAAREGREVIA